MDSLNTLKELSSQMQFEADGNVLSSSKGEPKVHPGAPVCYSPKEDDNAFTTHWVCGLTFLPP